MASIQFSSEDFVTACCKLSGKSDLIKLSLATFSFDKFRPESIFVKGLGANIFEKDLEEFVENKLNKSRTLFHEPTVTFNDDFNDSDNDESDDANDDDGDKVYDKNDETGGSYSDEDSGGQGFQHRQGIKVANVFIFREKSYESSEQECQNVKMQLKYAVQKTVPDSR